MVVPRSSQAPFSGTILHREEIVPIPNDEMILGKEATAKERNEIHQLPAGSPELDGIPFGEGKRYCFFDGAWPERMVTDANPYPSTE